MSHVEEEHRKERGNMKAAGISFLAVLVFLTLSCGGGDRVESALDDSYALGESTSALILETLEAEGQLFTSLEFQSFPYREVRVLETVPAMVETCGVRYQLSADAWGIVPDLQFSCADENAMQEALGDARRRVMSGLQRSEDGYEARLGAVREPVRSMTDYGPTLAYARSLGVRFNLESCVARVKDLLSQSAASASSLQCETFLGPGPTLDAYRTRLRDVAGRAEGLTTTVSGYPPVPLSPEVAARCGATPGAGNLAVPGSVSGTLGSRPVAYAIHLGAGQDVEIDLSSGSFDTELSLYDGSCNSRLSYNDDGGGGTDSQISWSSTGGGDFVLVVASFQGSGRGPYVLSVSADTGERPLTAQDQEALRAFVQWVTNASDEEVLSAWRGNAGADLQLGCARREYFRSQAAAQAAVAAEAVSICMGALERATEARKAVLGGGE
jgi:hypothetical protein